MKYELRLSNRAQRDLDGLQQKDFSRILKALQRLEENPHIGYPLLGKLKGRWKLRVGMFRIIYAIEENELHVLVITIGHRREVYKRK